MGLDEARGLGVDWWAVGVMLFEFLAGHPPFNAPTKEEVFCRIVNEGLYSWQLLRDGYH